MLAGFICRLRLLDLLYNLRVYIWYAGWLCRLSWLAAIVSMLAGMLAMLAVLASW
jgi:hypothetical protein